MSVTNAILIRYPTGYQWVEDIDSQAEEWGRCEAGLNLNGITSPTEAATVGQAVLDARSRPVTATTVVLEPADPSQEPYTAFRAGDWVEAPGEDGVPAQVRVAALTVAFDDLGNPVFTPELGQVFEDTEAKLARILQRYANGTLAGSTDVGSAPSDPPGGSAPEDPAPGVEEEPLPEATTEPEIGSSLVEPNLCGDITIGVDPANPPTDPSALTGAPDPCAPANPGDPVDPGTLTIFATVIVPGPACDPDTDPDCPNPNALEITPERIKAGAATKYVVDGEAELNDTTTVGSDGGLVWDYDIGEDSVPYRGTPGASTPDFDPNDPTKGVAFAASTALNGIVAFIGRLWGPKGSTTDATYIDPNAGAGGNGLLHVGGTLDLTDAEVLGFSGGARRIPGSFPGPIVAGVTTPWPVAADGTITEIALACHPDFLPDADVTVNLVVNGSTEATATLSSGSSFELTGSLTVSVTANDLVWFEVAADDANGQHLTAIARGAE